MGNVTSDIFRTYGLPGLGVLLVLGLIVWIVIHRAAEPGSEIRLLWGLATYKKKYRRATRKKKRPTEVIHVQTNTLWRILVPPEEWIDDDLTTFGSHYLEKLLAGPHCTICKTDLGYSKGGLQRIRRHCLKCDTEILPEQISDSRRDFKKYILDSLQEAHLNGRKITFGMKLEPRDSDR